MAIAQVQTSHAVATASPAVWSLSSAPTAGTLLVAALTTITANTAGWATPPGWNAARVENEAAVFWKISDGTETNVNFSYSGAVATRLWCIELSGAAATSPFDTSGYAIAATATSYTLTADAVAAVDDEWAIAMTGQNGTIGSGESASNGYVLLATGNSRDVAASRTYVGGAGGTITTTIGWGTTRTGKWIIASFKPGVGGVPKSASDSGSASEITTLTTPSGVFKFASDRGIASDTSARIPTRAELLARSNLVTITGLRTTQYKNDNPGNDFCLDSRTAINQYDPSDGTLAPVAIGKDFHPFNPSVVGGKFVGNYARDLDYQFVKDNYDAAGCRVEGQGLLVGYDHWYTNIEDGWEPHPSEPADGNVTDKWYLEGSYFEWIRDDAVENDQCMSGWMVDCYVDGANAVVSEQAITQEIVNPNSVVEISDCLFHMRGDMPNAIHVGGSGYNVVFKWRPGAGKINVHDTLILLDEKPNTANAPWPGRRADGAGDGSTYSNVTVFLGPGYGTDDTSTYLPTTGVTVTTDLTAWNAAVASWQAAHPAFFPTSPSVSDSGVAVDSVTGRGIALSDSGGGSDQAQVLTLVAGPAFQGGAFQADAFDAVPLGPPVGTIVTTLPALTTAVTVITPIRCTIASTLPSLTTAALAVTPNRGTIVTTLPSISASLIAATSTPTQGTIAVTLPAFTQSVIASGLMQATVASTLPKVSTAIVAIRGTVTPTTGTATSTLPKLTTALTAHSGAGAPSIGAVVQALGALSMSSTMLVSTPTPPSTPSGVQGLVHIFIKGAASRVLPEQTTGVPFQFVGGFKDRSSMVGGFQSATGTISPDEYNAHTSVYTVGATWIVKDLALETAGLNPYIFGGELKQPQIAGGQVELAADGWGLLQDRNIERFLIASMALDQWAPGDEDPFKFPGGARILAEVRAARLVFEVKRKTHFTRNDAGQPGTWRSVPLVFWAPKTDLRWIKFQINATGRSMSQYDLELVGTPTGPTGALTVLQTWNLNNNLADAVKSFSIPAGYDLIGLRVVRSSEAKRAPHVRVTISDVKVGSLATSEPYTLNQAFTALFGKMGAASTTIAANTMNVVPYDAARVPLSDIADDLSIFGQWYWRMWADSTGVMRGEAGPIGQTNYDVQLVHTPIRLLPQPRYNVVQFDYAYGGGYTSQETVRANPDPFPGTDITYTLDLPEPPTFALAQAFAQTIANILSKPWYSGTGTLHKVNPGNKPAGVVKPGDQLTLLNYGSVQVIVDEMTHSEDGSIVEAQFSESSKLVDRWLARFQQRINRGLSPNAAVIDLLDIAEPKAPTINAGFSVSQKREGRKDYDLQAIATTVNEDIESVGTYVSKYEFRARPIYPVGHASAGQPIPDNKGGGWRPRSIRAPKDGEADETKAVTWEKIHNPKDWAWEVQGWAVDALGQKSNRATNNAGRPVGLGPPNPTTGSLDVDQHVMRVSHTIPVDPDDATEPHQDYHHAIIKINDTNSNWGTPLRVDRKVKAETKSFRFHKPIDGQTYYAQITYVDWWGNSSTTPLVVSNSKKVPPLPVIGTPDFDANGSRHARYRLRVPVTINDASHDDHIKRILVQCSHKTTNVTPVLADKKFRDWVRTNDDPQEALFRNLPKTHYVFVRAMTVDADQKESGWSSWVAMGRPKDSGVTVTPPQPSWQATAATINVTTPTPRRLVVNWDDPDDDEATRWRVVIKQGVTVKDTIRTRNTRAVYRVPTADVGLTHTAEVYATNDLGVESAVVTGTGAPTPDAGGVGNPPNVPSNPSFVTDGRGSRHAKYRVIVTAGTSTTDGTHDAAHAYILQIAHDATDSGANPPAGAKRQHGRVEGDATGDDLQEVFRSIPKRHYMWVRERARNAAGASAWTGWRTSSRSIDFGVAVAPNAPTGVSVSTPAPRRVKVTWNDPDDDETIRWRVEIRRSGGTVETGFTRSTRYIYHVPKAFTNVAHQARVFAISDTGTDSSQVDSLDGIPNDDAAGYDIGDIIPRGHAAVPSGWLLCNGATNTPISAYPALFALYGTLYGGDGVNTFGVPDIRGRHPVGVGTNVALGGDEGDSEVNRSAVHIHGQDNTSATPTDDNTETYPDTDTTAGDGGTGDNPQSPPDDATLESVNHTHGLGMNTGGPSGGGVDNIPGNGSRSATGTSHTHNVPGPTDVRSAQHPHQHGSTHYHGHGHGHNPHPHPHGHNKHKHGHGHGGHPHPHPHDQKKRPHKGMHWIVKAA